MSQPLTIKQLAYELNLPRDWIEEQASAGRIPCLNVDGRYLFNQAAVEKAISEIAATSTVGEVATQ
jgi:excisionase family DNA binding protein